MSRSDAEVAVDRRCDSGWLDRRVSSGCHGGLDDSGCGGLLPPADFNSDGTVGILDLLMLLAEWGACA